MNVSETEKLVDWNQVEEVLGVFPDAEEQEILRDMWRSMVSDLDKECAALDVESKEQELKESLHRVRGFVSMWGMVSLTQLLLDIEKSGNARARWSDGRGDVQQLRQASIKVIEEKYPCLKA